MTSSISGYAQERRTAVLKMKYEISSTETTIKAELTVLIPKTIDKAQKVIKTEYAPQPDTIIRNNDNEYAIFTIDSLSAKKYIEINTTVDIYEFDLKMAKIDKSITLNSYPLEDYLISEKYLEKDSAQIKTTANLLLSKTKIRTIKNIYKFTLNEVKYTQYTNTDNGALNALETKRSDCSGFSDLFVSLCRANDIPARVVYGFLTEYGSNPRHAWAEAYTNEYGWIRFDPTPYQSIKFDKLKNMYIQISDVRNDKILRNGYFYTYRYMGDPINLKETIDITKSLPHN
ncbi:MAG: transglutaminase domain-containing protein [Flavobacteriales bacterium]|nr:transglutaminase domain-containing protein [Flavobacteriales bacterium]MBK7246612.1 transglutaminase domain-containing protein [Flavobacteriales bacterium]QQS72289.1 MAG: transglutaminase domain-containing protein [Flavobacteriales bacterium]HQV39591.1 transglutaminase-like domain-containing protein [Flavobacteriales bacterium]HQW33091.1 transglutaminase-like domain-containing protein [Flavobacteriales bacterium]